MGTVVGFRFLFYGRCADGKRRGDALNPCAGTTESLLASPWWHSLLGAINEPTAALAQHHAVAGRLEFWQGWTATLGSHNSRYVNPFVRGLRSLRWLRISSTVGRRRPITRIVGKPAPVASYFDWIPSPCSDGFRLLPAVAGVHLAGPVFSVSLLTPAASGVLKSRRAGLLSGMGLPCLLLWRWWGAVVDDGGPSHVVCRFCAWLG